jgi:hypothetical protein
VSNATPLRVFISYSHDSEEHRKRVLGLSERLRQDGLSAALDQYEKGTPEEGWPRWMLDRLDEADRVLVVCTETYHRRFRGREAPGIGKGADWEGAVITQQLYDARSRTGKFFPVLFRREDEKWIPEPLRGRSFYVMDSDKSYDQLYDDLLGQTGVEPRPLGTVRRRARRQGEPLAFEEERPVAPNPGGEALAASEPSVVPREGSGRVLDAAMASHIVKDEAAELDVLVRLPESQGLKGILQADDTAEARPEDVQSKPFKMTFPVVRDGRLGPRNVTVTIEAPNFRPPKQEKSFLVPPDADSDVLNFLMTPNRTGRLPVLVELRWEEAMRGQRRLRTECVAQAVALPARAVRNLVRLPIEVGPAPSETKVRPDTAPDPTPLGIPSRGPVESGGGRGSPPGGKGWVTPTRLAGVVVVGAAAVFAPGPALRLFETKSFATCARDVLVKSQHTDERKAFQVGMRLQDLLTADGGGSPLVMSNENHFQTEYQLLSDDNQRLLIQACASQYGIQLSRPVLRATVTAVANTQRHLPQVQIALGGDERQACTTQDNGACDLTIEKSATETFKLTARAKGYSDAEQTVAGSAFLGGVKFVLARASTSFVVVVLRNHREVEGARVEVFPEPPGTEVWSAACEATTATAECQKEPTNSGGEATFYRSAPFASASADVSIAGERRSFSLDGGPNIRARYRLNWENGAPARPPPPPDGGGLCSKELAEYDRVRGDCAAGPCLPSLYATAKLDACRACFAAKSAYEGCPK